MPAGVMMTESFRIPIDIDHDLRKDAAASDLLDRVLQIIKQKGHFRHVTERSLLAEDSDEDEDDNAHPQQQDEEEETSEKRDERLQKGRDDMFRQLERAQNDTLVALETVSFLLSKHSIPASSTMSEELKKRVQTGTLDSKVVQPRETPEAKAKRFMMNSRGWRSKSFGTISQNLATASNRLHSEAERESRYWEEVATLRARGIAISRYPRESHAVAVHFGSTSSGPQFQQRGIALLRQDADSEVYIDQGPAAKRENRLQVEIFRGACRTGLYISSLGAKDNTDITLTILEARDALTVDELLQEISREARITTNQGVSIRDQSISFCVEDEYEVAVTVKPAARESNPVLADDPLAEHICLSLRSLLQEDHQQNYSRRIHTPPAMVSKPSQAPEYAILRPLIASLRHYALIHELCAKISERLLDPVRRAGLDIDWRDSSSDSEESEETKDVNHIVSPDRISRSTFTCVLPTQRKVRIVVTSHLGSPTYGTRYEVSGVDHLPAPVKQNVYQTLDTTVSGLTDLLILDLVALTTSILAKGLGEASLPTGGWEVSRPHSGELTLRSSQSQKVAAGMKIDVVDAKLILRISPAKPDYQKGKKVLAWVWSHGELSRQHLVTGHSGDVGIDQTVAERLSFREVVEKSLAIAW